MNPAVPRRLSLTLAEARLRSDIIQSMRSQGFSVGGRIAPGSDGGRAYREIQMRAKQDQAGAHRKFIESFSETARKFVANGADIDPERISLEIREVESRTMLAGLFRWWNLVWWSMPYQQPYGRQMRFFVWDTHHDLPFGMFLLQSPLLRFAPRDRHLGMPRKNIDKWANTGMSAQRVGAFPPYNGLIGGKMAALAMTSNEVRARYSAKYGGKRTIMQGRRIRADLMWITTTSAFGRSSMYDRLRYGKDLAAIPIGYTQGVGTFHLSDSLTRGLYGVLQRRGIGTSTSYGTGPSRKIKLVKRALTCLGIKSFYAHGLRRQAYLFPLASNLEDVIRRRKRPAWIDRPFGDIQEYWKERWALPRCARMPQWREFDSGEFIRGVTEQLGKEG